MFDITDERCDNEVHTSSFATISNNNMVEAQKREAEYHRYHLCLIIGPEMMRNSRTVAGR